MPCNDIHFEVSRPHTHRTMNIFTLFLAKYDYTIRKSSAHALREFSIGLNFTCSWFFQQKRISCSCRRFRTGSDTKNPFNVQAIDFVFKLWHIFCNIKPSCRWQFNLWPSTRQKLDEDPNLGSDKKLSVGLKQKIDSRACALRITIVFGRIKFDVDSVLYIEQMALDMMSTPVWSWNVGRPIVSIHKIFRIAIADSTLYTHE